MSAPEMREPIESGCPDGFQYMHPTMRRNFGLWAYHEDIVPGVMVHVAKNGVLNVSLMSLHCVT